MEVRKYFQWVWVKGEIGHGLFTSVFAVVYAGLGYSGWLGETWARENHGNVAMLALVIGLCLLGFGYLQERAERIRSGSSKQQQHLLSSSA